MKVTMFFLIYFLLFSFSLANSAQMAPMPPLNAQDIDSILNNMSEKEFNDILDQLSKMSPQELEELEKIGRQVLIDSGIDPDTGKELAKETGPKPIAPTPAPEIQNKKKEVPAEAKPIKQRYTQDQLRKILDTIKKHIDALRQKAHNHTTIARRIAQWEDALSDLIFYIKVINHKEHLERLGAPEYEQLVYHMQLLAQQLSSTQPSITVPEKKQLADDPYITLGVPYDATEEQITRSYLTKKEQLDTKKIKARLRKLNATTKEIKREVRAAEITMALVQDAYDQLHDPKTKALVDEKRAAQQDGDLSLVSQSNLTRALEAISTAVYQHKVVEQLQEFVRKYEPEQLAIKQELDKEKALRAKEEVERAKVKPILTTGKFDRTDYKQPQPTYQPQVPVNYPPYYGGGAYGQPSALAPAAKPAEQKPATPGAGTGVAKSAAEKAKEPKTEKELEKEEKEKKKKEEADKKKKEEKAKEQEDLLKKMAADIEELKKPKAPTSTEEKPKNAPAERAQDNPANMVLKPTSEQIFKLQISARDGLTKFKFAMRSPAIHRILSQTKGGKKPLSEESLEELLTLPFTRVIEELKRMHQALVSSSPDTIDTIRDGWKSIEQDFTMMIDQLKTHVNRETQKYRAGNKSIPATLTEIAEKTELLIQLYNTISYSINQHKPIKDTLPIEDIIEDTEDLRV